MSWHRHGRLTRATSAGPVELPLKQVEEFLTVPFSLRRTRLMQALVLRNTGPTPSDIDLHSCQLLDL